MIAIESRRLGHQRYRTKHKMKIRNQILNEVKEKFEYLWNKNVFDVDEFRKFISKLELCKDKNNPSESRAGINDEGIIKHKMNHSQVASSSTARSSENETILDTRKGLCKCGHIEDIHKNGEDCWVFGCLCKKYELDKIKLKEVKK